MSFLYQDLAAEFDTASSLARVRFVVDKMTTALEFDHWHYERASYDNYTRPQNMVMGNLPPEWGQRERLHEPTRLGVEASKQRLNFGYLPSAKIWGAAHPDETPEARLPSYQGFLVPTDETSGWSQAARGCDGASLGMFSLVRQNKALTTFEITQKQTHIYWLAHALHDKITKFQASPFEISPVEREIMRWTADGKSTAEIALILEMKERTVTFRINNVTARMGVQNKTAAAVRLAVSGLLF